VQSQVVTTVEEWSALRDEWQELLVSARGQTLFLTWEWLDSWIRVQTPPPRLLIVCVRDGTGRLVGAAPHYRVEYRLLKTVPYRVLHPVGDTDSGAEYQTWIARPSVESAVFGQIVRTLRERRPQWDLIWMPRLEAWTGTHEPLMAAMREGGLALNHRPRVFGAVSLPETFEAYLAQMSANRRQQVRRTMRRRLDRPTVEVRRVSSEGEVQPALASLFDLNARRWTAVGEDGAFARRPGARAFYQEFAPRALGRGWLAFYSLLDEGRPVAAQLGYVYGRTFLQLQEGFDPEYSSNVGNALRARVIEDCIDRGLTEYDFLGGASEHKRRWLSKTRAGLDLLAAHRGLKNAPIIHGRVFPTGAYLRPLPGGQTSAVEPVPALHVHPAAARRCAGRLAGSLSVNA
jgi:CelD/BcsL family acetyltransferase involved in cellulose biosynthesis